MSARAEETKDSVAEGHDYLFNWKSKRWPIEELRKVVAAFDTSGWAEEWWSCSAFRKVRPGDRAYLLSQDKPPGIFGRGHIGDELPKEIDQPSGWNTWHAPIRFDAARGDLLWDPSKHLLVDKNQLLAMPSADRFMRIRAAGVTLDSAAARKIDRIIDSLLAPPESAQEIARLIRLGEQATRPGQREFSEEIRRNYDGRCALTGCATPAALQAAHIRIGDRSDDNTPANGILLRADIHALFDRLLITFSEDGSKVEVAPELTDPTYDWLRAVKVAPPIQGPAPSAENIRHHRDRFLKQCPGRK